MSFSIELNNHPQGKRFSIKLHGIRTKFYADNNFEISLALDHYFRGKETDPGHWGEGVPKCPLCEAIKT